MTCTFIYHSGTDSGVKNSRIEYHYVYLARKILWNTCVLHQGQGYHAMYYLIFMDMHFHKIFFLQLMVWRNHNYIAKKAFAWEWYYSSTRNYFTLLFCITYVFLLQYSCLDFGTSVNPISTRGGGRLCPNITTGTPGFSDLPTALRGCVRKTTQKLIVHASPLLTIPKINGFCLEFWTVDKDH